VDAAWPIATLVAASVFAWEAINAMTNLHSSFPMQTVTSYRRQGVPTREIVVPRGVGMGLPTLLLGSKKHRRFLGHAGASQFSIPAPKILSGPLLRPPVEILLDAKF
jgi:hypothetical protein